jgi:hypothetical protein
MTVSDECLSNNGWKQRGIFFGVWRVFAIVLAEFWLRTPLCLRTFFSVRVPKLYGTRSPFGPAGFNRVANDCFAPSDNKYTSHDGASRFRFM